MRRRRSSARADQRARARADRAARPERSGLWQSDAARQRKSGSARSDADEPHVRFDALGDVDGLIALTGGPAGPIDRALAAGLSDLARARLARLAALFDKRLYVELQRHDLESEKAVEPHLLDLAYAASLPLVATNEPYFAGRRRS